MEVLSHHGSEHYCPVSMFKIYGVSELEIMAQDGEDDPADEVPILTPSAVTQGTSHKLIGRIFVDFQESKSILFCSRPSSVS